MFRRIANAALLAVAGAPVLAGCGGGGDDDGQRTLAALRAVDAQAGPPDAQAVPADPALRLAHGRFVLGAHADALLADQTVPVLHLIVPVWEPIESEVRRGLAEAAARPGVPVLVDGDLLADAVAVADRLRALGVAPLWVVKR